nr:phospholipid-transporting ATPase IF-like isoform X2 [Procambarus clarkii]
MEAGEGGTRRVEVNRPPQLVNTAPITHFPDNSITTSKYTLVTFLPKNLFEQFRRLANFYFLCLAIIHLTIDSPVSPMTSILPLVFVVAVTAVKQGYEDWLRHREDNKVNNAASRVLRDGVVTEVRRRDIIVGDVVEVADEEEFPCDLVLLASHHPEATCDVITANLDGETNLKTFLCPTLTSDLHSPRDLWHLSATIVCQLPHPNLYDFKGRLEVYRGVSLADTASQADTASLATENLLPRGARLKNTSTVYGVAVYTGMETKMALNSKRASNKFSTVEKSMNYFLAFFLLVLALEVAACTALKYHLYDHDVMSTMWYVGQTNNGTVTFDDVYQDIFSFLIIFSYIIPISLYVTLEMQKFLGTMFLRWDEDVALGGGGDDDGARVNTSDLNEELGQVKYLFTDKTGTLTENIMHFRQCSVEGVRYTEAEGGLHLLREETFASKPLGHLPEAVVRFLVTLALCHTVQAVSPHPTPEDPTPEEPTHEEGAGMQELIPEYHASSPDEKAIVEACARCGVVFAGMKGSQASVRVRGRLWSYTRLQVLHFDPDRKCMSVVVREEASGKIWLLTKGAESSVLKRCCINTPELERLHYTTLSHINDYAMRGLRTLAVGRRELSYKQYRILADQLENARQVVEDREAAVKEVMENMETELRLLGATAVEDLLQEGVQETLESLRAAGIKVWVLTGDKVETAVNIAYSCGHFKRFMTVLSLTGLRDLDHAVASLRQCQEASRAEGSFGLVVDGVSLLWLLDHLRDDFYTLCRRCWAVVCCRMSPRQKAETVRLVKTSSERPVCAAVGDGANDVPMIKEANVGLGIMGKEGRQAVRCADFGISRFRFLQKVLFVHGHWNYVRVTVFVQFSFYKNVAFNTPIVFYTAWSALSTQCVYESLVLTMFNITFTTLPVLVFGLFEQNLPSHLLLSRPHLYQRNADNVGMSWRLFFKWNLFALWHALVMYLGLMLVCFDDTCGLPDGQTPDLYLFGLALGTLCVFVTNLKIALESHYCTIVFVGSLLITFLGYSATYIIYSGLPVEPFTTYGIFWVYYRMLESASLNLACVVLGLLALLPDALSKVYDHTLDRERRVLKRGRLIKQDAPNPSATKNIATFWFNKTCKNQVTKF